MFIKLFSHLYLHRVFDKHLSGGGSSAPPFGWTPGAGDAGSSYWLVGEQSISAHVNMPKRKSERKVMHASDQSFPKRWWDEFHVSGEMEGDGKFCYGINLYGGGNLRRSDSDHSNFFQGQKQHVVNTGQ